MIIQAKAIKLLLIEHLHHILDREYIELICYIMAAQSNLDRTVKSRYSEEQIRRKVKSLLITVIKI
jgi:hypothetical protein